VFPRAALAGAQVQTVKVSKFRNSRTHRRLGGLI
jgi:hypothetical protein